jgi:hypothetical protein
VTTYRTAQVQLYAPMGVPTYRVRAYRDSDEAHVVVTWTADVAKSPTFSEVPYQHAFLAIRPHVRAALKDLRHLIAVVVPDDADEPICAYSVVDESTDIPVVHHLHVKGDFRGQGLMTDLLSMQGLAPGSTLIAASDTRDLRRIKNRGLYDIHVRPELLLGRLNPGL